MAGVSQPAFTPSTPIHRAPATPRWIAPWLALLAPLYVLSPLALLALPQLRKLPLTARYILAFYAVSQQLPALFSPEPLLASGLALARTLLMFGLLGVGAALGASERLKPVAIGLGVVFGTAVVYSAVGGTDVFISRLGHPYMTSITLGLGGAFGVWLALFTRGRLLWRVPLGLSGLAVLLLSGSRGPLAAALVGCLAGFVIQRGRRVGAALLLGAALLAGGLFVGDRLGVGAIARLGSSDTTGRDLVWYNTLTVIRSQPWSGVGSYRLGRYLSPPGDNCTLFASTDGTAPVCPVWVKNLGNPWLIAHNATLQQLAETGPLGLLGLFLLLGAVLTACVQNRSPLGMAVVSGLMVATINDSTLLVPSPFFAELFWVVAGTQLLQLRPMTLPTSLLSAGVAIVLSAPVLAGSFLPERQVLAHLSFLNAPTRVTTTRAYQVIVQFDLPPGDYRASLDSCLDYCVTLATQKFTVTAKSSPLLFIKSDIFHTRNQRMELRLLTGKSSSNIQPLGISSWTVMKEK